MWATCDLLEPQLILLEEEFGDLSAQQRSTKCTGNSGERDQERSGNAGASEVSRRDDDDRDENGERNRNAYEQDPSPGASGTQQAQKHGGNGDSQGREQSVGFFHGFDENVEQATADAEEKGEKSEEKGKSFRAG